MAFVREGIERVEAVKGLDERGERTNRE